MPTYAFRNKDTGEEWTEFMGISEAEEYLASNPHVERLINGAPGIVGGMNLKPESGFRDVLKEIKKKHRGSTINTF